MDLYYSHSKPHEIALRSIKNKGYNSTIDYFTGKYFPYSKNIEGSVKKFWPVTFPVFSKRHAWKKQKSSWHFLYYKKNIPDVTIINMSGHGSAYIFSLAKEITKQNKAYIAMIGGIHVSNHGMRNAVL